MKVKEVMTQSVEVVAPNATLEEVAAKMRRLDVGILPIHDGSRVMGVVTDRDLTLRATASGLDPMETAVRKVMTEKIHSCYEDQDVEEAAGVMGREQVRRLLVFARDGRLAGLVSLGDLAVNDAEADEEVTAKALKAVSQPAALHSNK